MEIVDVKISELIPADYNPRRLTKKQGDDIRASLESFGFVDPVIVNQHPDRLNVIVGGHQRVKVWELMGNDTVPVFFVNLEEARERELNVRLNKNSGEWDWDILANQFDIEDLKAWGFDNTEFGFEQLEPDETIGDDDAPGIMPDVVTVLGDVYDLGGHRLVCGDAKDAGAYEALLGGGGADMCWTDPPYNVAYIGKTKAALKIKNDSMGDGAFGEFLADVFTSVFAYMREGGPIYVAHADTEGRNFRSAFQDAGFKLSGCLIWKKDSMVLGRSDYQWIHEPILYGWKPGGAHTWVGGRKNVTFTDVASSPFTQLSDGRWQIEIGEEVLIVSGDAELSAVPGSVFHHKRPQRSSDHPTMKPVALVEKMMRNSSSTGATVMDPFAGSGSTMIACIRLNRSARLIELDPKYCDVIVRRYIKFCSENGRECTVIRNGEPCHDFES